MTRFDDDRRYLVEFMDHADVRCPKCDCKAAVTRRTEASAARVVCSSCPFAASIEETGWLGPMRGLVRRRCGMCGQWLERRLSGPRPPRVAHLACTCGFEFDEDVIMERVINGPVDPVFGLELWLTALFRNELVWAYNVEHLRFLREFVGADIRERVPNQNSSLASRLPRWMKAAKNRTALLAVINGLEDRADT